MVSPAQDNQTPNAGPDRATVNDRAFAQTAQPIAVADFDGRIVRVNRAFEEMTGYSADDIATLTIADLTPTGWRALADRTLSQVRATGISARYEKEYRRKDGRLVPVEVAVDLDRDEGGVPVGYFAFITDIGERKRMETALRDSEERFRRLYDEAPVGYYEIDEAGTIIRINRTGCEMLGYGRDELLGHSVADLVPEEFREGDLRALAAMFREGGSPRPRGKMATERTFLTKDGRRMNIVVEERLDRDDRGRVVGLRGTLQDVTEQVRMERDLVASERRARALFEGIEDAVIVHAPEGPILDVNASACRLFGYTRDEFLTLSTRDIDDPEFAAGYNERVGHQFRKGRLLCEGRQRAKDGRAIPVDINTSTIDFEGRRSILAVVRDVTERQALEMTRRELAEAQARSALDLEAKNRALTESEARYRQLTEGSLDAVIVADRDGRIVLFNPSAARTFGWSADEVLGQSLTTLMPEGLRDSHDIGITRYLETRDPRLVGKTVEVQGLRKNGETFPLELSLNAIELAGELQFIGSIRDQTERQRMRAMLARSDKLASIGLLSAGVAHEINNPLAYVGNNLAVLERDLKGVLVMMEHYESAHGALAATVPDVLRAVEELSEEIDWPYIREHLEHILARTRDGVQRVANIVQNLRGLARTAPPKLEPASLPDLVSSGLEMIQGRLRRQSITSEVDHGDVPRISCVPSQIGQVILNLLINATQAVEARTNGKDEGGMIQVTTRQEGEYGAITVADNGDGIDPEHLPHLFDPFFTTKPVGEGTGLGLSISHGIVTGHGGRIEVEPRPGGGTVFRVLLPLKPT